MGGGWGGAGTLGGADRIRSPGLGVTSRVQLWLAGLGLVFKLWRELKAPVLGKVLQFIFPR